jgi:hypothetical protein
MWRDLCCGLRHRLLISWGRRTGVGNHPQVTGRLVILSSWWPRYELWDHGSRRSGWPPGQGLHHGSHPVVGRIVHASYWTVSGRWALYLAITAMRCCLVHAAWHKDGVWPEWGDCSPPGPCRVSATCTLQSEQACLVGFDLSSFLPRVGTVERSCVSYVSCN